MAEDDLKHLLETIRQENASAHAETRRHFDVVAERLDRRIDAVAESVAVVDEKLDRRIDDLEQRMDRGFAETQAMIKFSHDELDRRIRSLEQRYRTLEQILGDLQARVERLEGSPH